MGIDAFDLLTEARWEAEGTRRALKRYREAAATADPSSLPSGQKLLREVVPPLSQKLTELQLQGAAPGNRWKWAAPIQLLEPATMAVITIARALRAGENPYSPGSTLAALALDIAASMRDEVSYRNWIEAQEDANAAAKRAKDWSKPNLLKAFKARYPNVDRNTWRKFQRKLEDAERLDWSKETMIQLGTTLIHGLLEAAPERFELVTQTVPGGKKRNHIGLSAETLELMRDVEARAEVARPMLMPMLIPPIPWRYE